MGQVFLSCNPREGRCTWTGKILSQCLSPLGIEDILDQSSTHRTEVMVGGGTDGASVNIAHQNGMRGIIKVPIHGLCGLGAMLVT